jgi:molecular chaperone GrpE
MRRGYKVGDLVVRHAMVGVVDTVPDAGDNTDAGEQQAAESNDD